MKPIELNYHRQPRLKCCENCIYKSTMPIIPRHNLRETYFCTLMENLPVHQTAICDRFAPED